MKKKYAEKQAKKPNQSNTFETKLINQKKKNSKKSNKPTENAKAAQKKMIQMRPE